MKPRQQETPAHSGQPGARQQRKTRPGRLFPLLVIAVIIMMAVRDQVPFVDNWVTKLVSPDLWQARETCKAAALTRLDKPEFARLLALGEAHKTEAGYLVKRVVFGQMSAEHSEETVRFSCYLDESINLVRITTVP